jgi:hypothetical protein
MSHQPTHAVDRTTIFGNPKTAFCGRNLQRSNSSTTLRPVFITKTTHLREVDCAGCAIALYRYFK